MQTFVAACLLQAAQTWQRDSACCIDIGGSREFLVRVSYLEIYQEEVHDLLSKTPHQRLELKENLDRGVYVKGLLQFVVKGIDEINSVLQVGFVVGLAESCNNSLLGCSVPVLVPEVVNPLIGYHKHKRNGAVVEHFSVTARQAAAYACHAKGAGPCQHHLVRPLLHHYRAVLCTINQFMNSADHVRYGRSILWWLTSIPDGVLLEVQKDGCVGIFMSSGEYIMHCHSSLYCKSIVADVSSSHCSYDQCGHT